MVIKESTPHHTGKKKHESTDSKSLWVFVQEISNI